MKTKINQLEIGDLVIVSPHIGEKFVSTVDRTTNTLVVVNGMKFRKSDDSCARKIGSESYWRHTFIRIPQEGQIAEIQEQMKRRKIIYELEKIGYANMATETLEKILLLSKPK